MASMPSRVGYEDPGIPRRKQEDGLGHLPQDSAAKAYLENRRKFPLEKLADYVGQWIAWNLDGTGITASAPDVKELNERLRRAGIDPVQCVKELIPRGQDIGQLLRST